MRRKTVSRVNSPAPMSTASPSKRRTIPSPISKSPLSVASSKRAIETVSPKHAMPVLSKGRRAIVTMSPSDNLSAAPVRSKQKTNACMSSNTLVSSAPSLKGRRAKGRLPSDIRLPVDPSLENAGHNLIDAPDATASILPLSESSGLVASDIPASSASALPSSGKGHLRVATRRTDANAPPSSATDHQHDDALASNVDSRPSLDRVSHLKHVVQHHLADSDPLSLDRVDHQCHAAPSLPVDNDPPSLDRADHYVPVNLSRDVGADPSLILPLRELARQRNDLLRAWQRLGNQVGAINRRGANVSIASSAAPVLVQLAATAMAARKDVEKSLQKLAKKLPVYEAFIKPTRGLGLPGFSFIIGETGDLSLYSNPAKVWKRMGLAVIDGQRQRRVKGSAEEALKHGYNAHRRSLMWNIGDSIIKVGGPYRAVYDARKLVEQQKEPEGRPALHHNRAKRYMEKRVLRDLWRAWRDLHGIAAS